MSSAFSVPALPFPVDAEIALPGSKSHANRAIVCAALAEGTTIIRHATPCDDVSVMVENLHKLGFDVQWTNEETGELTVKGGLPKTKDRSATLDCHNAGTTLRFLTSVACLVSGTWTVTGDSNMLRRPIGDLLTALRSLGADITDTNGALPLIICGGTLKGGTVDMKADISSQYLTSLLLVAPVLSGGLTVNLTGPLASEGYVDLTERVMEDFGVAVHAHGNGFSVQHAAYRSVAAYDVEGDWSAAGAWLVLQALTGSTIRFSNISHSSDQSDRHVPEVIEALRTPGDTEVDCAQIPDQLMNLALLAAFRTGTTRFTGARNLRYKECDRLHVISAELRKAGVDIDEEEDGVRVKGSKQAVLSHASKVTLDPHSDHRMAMCFAILGLLRGNVTIKDPDCVRKSYPGFFRDLDTVLRSSKPISIVGMRASGKSALARRLAKKLTLQHVDTDHVFVARHGPIKEYVAAHDWKKFREEEAKVVAECIRPGIVLSCGGGVTESESARKVLKSKTIGVWLQAKNSVLVERLRSGKRPALTTLPIEEEVAKVLRERSPHYREVSVLDIPSTVSFSKQAPYLLSKLRQYVLSYDMHSSSYS